MNVGNFYNWRNKFQAQFLSKKIVEAIFRKAKL